MSRVERYIFRQALVSLVLGLTVLTLVVWITQALRELDVVTAQGQALWIFLSLTALALPNVIVTLVPVALFVACFYTLYRLNSDSELIVMAAAGMPASRIARPFLALALLTSLLSAAFSLYVSPASSQVLRHVVTDVRADVVSSVLKEGRFMPLETDVTLYIEAREGALLRGLFLDDQRTPSEQSVYVAREARIASLEETSYLLMSSGTIQRRGEAADEVTTIEFDEYAIDLSSLAPRDTTIFYKARERSTADLLTADWSDPDYQRDLGKIRAELHDRFAVPLYPIALVLLVLALAARPRTNRQSRSRSVFLGAVALVALIASQFAATSATVSSPSGVPLIYAVPLTGALIGGWAAFSNRRPPWTDRMARRFDGARQALASRVSTRGGAAS